MSMFVSRVNILCQHIACLSIILCDSKAPSAEPWQQLQQLQLPTQLQNFQYFLQILRKEKSTKKLVSEERESRSSAAAEVGRVIDSVIDDVCRNV